MKLLELHQVKNNEMYIYKKILLYLIFFFLSNSLLFAQNWISQINPYSTGRVQITDGIYDGSNDRYILTGNFSDSIYFGISDTLIANNNNEGTFVVSYNENFDVNWIYEIDGDNNEVLSQIDVNKNGDIFVFGMFRSLNCSFSSD